MTRKRYIKLLMSRGTSRNRARKMALVVIDDTSEWNKYNHEKKQCGKVARVASMSYAYAYRLCLSRGIVK